MASDREYHSLCALQIVSFANTAYVGNKTANFRGDMARKAKVHIQTYYGLQKLSAEERADRVGWLLEKDASRALRSTEQ